MRRIVIYCALFTLQLLAVARIPGPVVPASVPAAEPAKEVAEMDGPSQPEVQTFQPADADNLVDHFTGDFKYNVPLMDVGGYPINLFYTSNVTVDDEASWVGLGWNLNPGAINRSVRGLPDDFNGEVVKRTISQKPNITIGLGSGVNMEFYGVAGFNAGGGLHYSTHTGPGFDLSAGSSLSCAIQDKFSDEKLASLGFSHGLKFSSESGVSQNSGLSFNHQAGFQANAGSTYSNGVYDYTLRTNVSKFLPDNLLTTRSTITPRANYAMTNLAADFKFSVGGEIQGIQLGGQFNGYLTYQGLASSEVNLPAYGYMYLHNADNKSLLDFNREHEDAFDESHPSLAPTVLTCDIFSVSGQGISGSFRAHRSDIGSYADNEVYAFNAGLSLGGDVAFGSLVKVGVDAGLNAGVNYSGRLAVLNGWKDVFKFKGSDGNNKFYEPFYFKSSSDVTVLRNESVLATLNKYEPAHSALNSYPVVPALFKNELSEKGNPVSQSALTNEKREIRNSCFNVTTVKDLYTSALDKQIPLYNLNSPYTEQPASVLTISNKPEDHVVQIEVTQPDGSRYFYGLPAYNLSKNEVAFNFSNEVNSARPELVNLVTYMPGNDNKPGHHHGIDEFYQNIETPAYAYAYLLTAIVTPDYVDLTGDGPSEDDLGSYTRFNYTKVADYGWRNPKQKNGAYFSAGHVQDKNDDMASYSYGQKEVFYLHSIESRNFVAEFKISRRLDQCSVIDENGSVEPNNNTYRLDSIQLFSKQERIKQEGMAVPIKTAHFVYDYSLCKQTPGSSAPASGKLTLKKLYFTYRQSERGALSPFEFSYDYNPEYNIRAKDRWGTYTQISDEPYTTQEKPAADLYASAWLLSNVHLPTGSDLRVNYEADDYAKVQDKAAMRMFKVAALTTSATFVPGNSMYNNALSAPNLYLHLKLEKENTTTDELDRYFAGLEELHFKIRVNVGTALESKYETLTGWGQIDGYGFTDNNHSKAWIHLKETAGEISNPLFKYHPFTVAAWDVYRKALSSPAQQIDPNADMLSQALQKVGGLISNLPQVLITDIYTKYKLEGRAFTIDLENSFVRLNDADSRKFGGGARVKSIGLTDNWIDGSHTYTKQFSYSLPGSNVSSGVASYEPETGNEENPFIVPDRYTKNLEFLSLPIYPSENRFVQNPVGESYYPAPVVGYSYVAEQDEQRNNIVGRGKIVHEFFTSADFPVKVEQTTAALSHTQLPPLPIPFVSVGVDLLTVSQGVCIRLNDMNGKLKAVKSFNSGGTLVSGEEYIYKIKDGILDNQQNVVSPDGKIEERTMGVDFDFLPDERESSNISGNVTAQVNVDVIMVPTPIPIPVPVTTVWPSLASQNVSYRSLGFTKIINQSGILSKTIRYDLGAVDSIENLLYDAYTGAVVVAKKRNEFGDAVYQTTLPAYWMYKGMGPSWQNIGVKAQLTVSGGGEVTGNNDFLYHGDELLLNNTTLAWVYQAGSKLFLMDALGNAISSGTPLAKVIRSGFRNMQALNAATISSLTNPIYHDSLHFENVINASANAFSGQWQNYAAYNIEQKRYKCNCTRNCFEDLFKLKCWKKDDKRHGDTCFVKAPEMCFLNKKGEDFMVVSSADKITYTELNRDAPVKIEVSALNGDTLPLDFFSLNWQYTYNVSSCSDAIFEVYGECKLPLNKIPNQVIQIRIKSYGVPLVSCSLEEIEPEFHCDLRPGDAVNPFRMGLSGNYRQSKSLSLVTDRTSSPLRSAGVLEKFRPYMTGGAVKSADASNWVAVSENTVYDPYGNLLESKDALGRKSSELLGFDNNFTIGRVTNSAYNQFAFESFEDFEYTNRDTTIAGECKLPLHLNFKKQADNITDEHSHTGYHSLFVGGKSMAKVAWHVPGRVDVVNPQPIYAIRKADFIKPFAPDTGRYWFSIWCKKDHTLDDTTTVIEAQVRLTYLNRSAELISLHLHGAQVEGWQQLNGEFTIAQPLDSFSLALVNRGSEAAYFDDLRIMPFNSSLKTYVFDSGTSRLMGQLDENNYAVLFEYDSDGTLVRKKQETERGIVTLEELRTSLPKKN